ncbi:hypothetical protein [Streptacidiphilus sp. EB129]|uniref:hypothetical protein n=1 Tax=Streptacidiphilus sp. EB129 TaxID=3156262 RepID=UPI003511A162
MSIDPGSDRPVGAARHPAMPGARAGAAANSLNPLNPFTPVRSHGLLDLPDGSGNTDVPGLPGSAGTRRIDPSDWAKAGPPLLRAPRELVTELHRVHRPQPGTAVLGVLEQDDHIVAGASFAARLGSGDGWQYRNAILTHLRRIVPHELRRARPARTAVLLQCRRGGPEWTEQDGAWMWALRDASMLHGLRFGAYVTLTDAGWQVIGERRSGRTPHAGSWATETVRTVSSLPLRPLPDPELGPSEPLRALAPAPARSAVR